MSCVNVKSKEYQSLLANFPKNQSIAVEVYTKKFLDSNNERFPTLIELKSIMAKQILGTDMKAFYSAVRSIVKDLLPGLSDAQIDDKIKFMDKLDLIRLRDGKDVLTTFINNTIYVANETLSERGTTDTYKDIRHEVFHMIFNNFLTSEERNNIVESFKRYFPAMNSIHDNETIEEKMADYFENYKNSPEKVKSFPQVIKDFFNSILEYFGIISKKGMDIQSLFNDINNGKFTRNDVKDSFTVRDKTLNNHVIFRDNPDLILKTKNYLLNSLNRLMFPENYKDISKQDYPMLFLDSEFGEDKNVANLSKIGLTKTEAISFISQKIKNIDLGLLSEEEKPVISALKNAELFKLVFEHIQPYTNIVIADSNINLSENKTSSNPDKISDDNLNSEDSSFNLTQEIQNKDTIDPKTKVSEVVKDFLSSIFYKRNENDYAAIDTGVGFVSLLDLFTGMYNNESIDSIITRVNENAKSRKGDQSNAVHVKLIELLESINSKNIIVIDIAKSKASKTSVDKLKTKLKEIGIETELDHSGKKLVITIPANITFKDNFTNGYDSKPYFEVNRQKEGKESFKIYKNPGELTRAYLKRIEQETGIPAFVVSHLYKAKENANTLASLTRVANSLRKVNPKFVKIDTKTNYDDEGNKFTTTNYVFVDRAGEYKDASAINNDIYNNLNTVETKNAVINLLKIYNAQKSKDSSILYRIIGPENLNVINPYDFNKLSQDFKISILKRFTDIVNTKGFDSTDELNELAKTDKLQAKISLIGREIVKRIYESNTTTSYETAGSKKRKWFQRMKNWNTVALFNLRDLANNIIKSDQLSPVFQNAVNNYMKFNPLLGIELGGNKINVDTKSLLVKDSDFLVDHEETFSENNTNSYVDKPVIFAKESRQNWITRNLVATFMDPVVDDSENENKDNDNYQLHYWQQKYQPESAPNVTMVKMGVLKHNEVRDRIRKMIIQEAYLNHKYGGQNFWTNISKRTGKSVISGIKNTNNSTYFLDENKKNIFFDENGNLNEAFVKKVGNKTIVSDKNDMVENLIDDVLANLKKSNENFVNQLIEHKVPLKSGSLIALNEKMKQHFSSENKLSKDEIESLNTINISPKDKSKVNLSDIQIQALNKLMSVYYNNVFVNSFFLNQLTSGVNQNYKSVADEIKRQAGVNAMGETGLVTNVPGVGMRPTFKIAVTENQEMFIPTSSPFAKISSFFNNKLIETADAQSFGIPEWFREVRDAHGRDANQGSAIKPVAFELNKEGLVFYWKTHVSEITNEMAKAFPERKAIRYNLTFKNYLDSIKDEEEKAKVKDRIDTLYNKLIDEGELKDINDEMEYGNIITDIKNGDHLVGILAFKSAIKGVAPTNMSTFTKNATTGLNEFNMNSDSIITMNSNNMSIQQNPRKRAIDTFISHFTQLTYIIGLNGTESSIKNNKIITSNLSKLSKTGVYDLLFELRAKYDVDGKLKINTNTREKLKKLLSKKLDLPGNEELVSFLKTAGISLNNPLFTEKLIQTINNSLSKAAVKFKHAGGKFVLQSEFGTEIEQAISDTGAKIPGRPKVVFDEKGKPLYAECYLPQMYANDLQAGDMMYYNNDQYNKMFGFRIPSSDLHSSVPMKIIGFYPSKSEDNIAIIPAEIINIHGADFDVDSLFVVRPGIYKGTEDSENLSGNNDQNELTGENKGTEYKTKFQNSNVVIAQKGIKFGYTVASATYDENNVITSFGDNNHKAVPNLEATLIDEKLSTQKEILKLEASKPTSKKGNTILENKRLQRAASEINNKIKTLEKHLETIKSVQKGLYSNNILDSVLDTIDYKGDNLEDSFMGISFDVAKGYSENSIYSKMAEEYSKLATADDKLAERPTMYTSLSQVDTGSEVYTAAVQFLNNKGIETTSEDGQKDLLDILNKNLEDGTIDNTGGWIDKRDAYLSRKMGKDDLDINKVDQHSDVHQDTNMASDLVGIIANFSKGVSYLFHSLIKGETEVKIDPALTISINGKKYDSFSREDDNGSKNQEFRSFSLNASIDHVKEQILNIINVGEKTIKIFMAASSMKMDHITSTWLMLQPVSKQLSQNIGTKPEGDLENMKVQLIEKYKELGGLEKSEITDEMINTTELSTENLGNQITKSFNDILTGESKEDIIHQLVVIKELKKLLAIGSEISDLTSSLSIIQDLPYTTEISHEKLVGINKYLDVQKFFNKLKLSETSEFDEPGFKDDLAVKSTFTNINLALNNNILSSLEAIKMQLDINSETFAQYSLQLKVVLNKLLEALNESSVIDYFALAPETVLDFNSVDKLTTADKYLVENKKFKILKLLSENFINYLLTGINVTYNKTDTNEGNILSLSISDQDLQNDSFIVKGDSKNGVQKQGEEVTYQMNAVKSFVNRFYLENKKHFVNGKYAGDKYLQSQINPEWRLKPLSLIRSEDKKSNNKNAFLQSLDFRIKDGINKISFNSNLKDSPEGLAELEQNVNDLNSLTNIYVKKNEKGDWVNVEAKEYPATQEMGEIIFNLLKASIYTDKMKFASNRVTAVIPIKYTIKIFKSLDANLTNMLYYQKNQNGDKYYFDYKDSKNLNNTNSVINDIKQNLLVNSLFSINDLLPKIRKSDKKTFEDKAGVTKNGAVYDLSVKKAVMDEAFDNVEDPTEDVNKNKLISDKETESLNDQTQEEKSTKEGEDSLAKKLKQNPSFISRAVFDKGKLKNQNDVYMRVDQSGAKDDVVYYYKYIGRFNNDLNNNSFDNNLLINKYEIKDYFDPTKLYLAVNPEVKYSENTLVIEDIKISGSKSTTLLSSKKNAEAVLNQIKTIGLYDVRKPDRIGLINYNIDSFKFNAEKNSVSLTLSKSPYQIDYKVSDNLNDILKETDISIQEKKNRLKSDLNFGSQELNSLSVTEINSRFEELKTAEKIIEELEC